MYNEAGDLQQEEELPTYNYLEEQESSNPNSRFGRWRSWVEKRAAERYADITDDDRERQRQRGWGTTVDTDTIEEAPSAAAPIMSPMSAQLVAQQLLPTGLSVYQFGSRFIPHSSTRITCLVPLVDERYLLLGSTEGMGVLDIFPEKDIQSTEDPLMLHPLEGAKRRDLWTGEAIYQMTILESYPDNKGGLQGVLLALVGPEESDLEREAPKSVRLYNLDSIFSLTKLVTSSPDAKTLEVHGPKGWTHQRTTSRRLQRSINQSVSLTRSLKSMVLDSHTGSRAATPSESTPSLTAPSISSDHPIPLHQDSKDSADSWDLVEDLPLRWATNYVNLATTGSKLATQQVLFYEAYKDEKKGTWMLAVATKTCILLYESPKDQKSFRFLREFYTPLPARSINFIYHASRDGSRLEGERLRKERPLSKLPEGGVNISPRAKRISTQGDQMPMYKSQLSMFVVFEKKAGLIRVADSAVIEIELWTEGENDPPPSSNPTSSPQSTHSSNSLPGFRLGGGSKAWWLPLVTVEIPNSALVTSGIDIPPVELTTVLLVSRGRQTHFFTSPLPIPMNARRPLRVVHWNAYPRQIVARLSIGSVEERRETKLHILAFTENGVEVIEMCLDFLASPPDVSWGKGKGTMKRAPVHPEPQIRTVWQPPEITGYLGRGGHWDGLDTSSGRSQMRHGQSNTGHAPITGTKVEQGQGLYVWLQKGLDDYRVAWLGEDVS